MTVSTTNPSSANDILGKLNYFGRFQVIQYILICLVSVINGMMMLNYVFITEPVDFRCRIQQCDFQNSTVQMPEWWDGKMDLRCHRPILNQDKYNKANQTCSSLTFNNEVEQCDEWIYEKESSFMAELNLGCQESKMTLIGTAHNAGMMVSNLFTGWICDRFGRRINVIVCSIGGIIGLAKIFVPNLYLYIGIEFLESLITSGVQTACLVLLMEIGGESKRVLVGVLFSYAFYTGEILYALSAMGLKYWKSLLIAIYTPNLLFIIYLLTLFESTRWEILKGKLKEAKETFKKIAKFNKLDISEEEIEGLSQQDFLTFSNLNEHSEKESFVDILKSKDIMIRVVVTCVSFFCVGFSYYGMAIQSVYLPGNKYINFILTSLTSYVGDYLAFVCFSKFGRRISLQGGFSLCSVCLMAQAFAPETILWLKVALFLFGKLGISMVFTGMFTYSLELFPTSVRGTLVGCGNTFARIGSTLSPLTPLLGKYMTNLPTILFSSAAALGAFLLCFTPETKVLPLFDTIAQINAYSKKSATL